MLSRFSYLWVLCAVVAQFLTSGAFAEPHDGGAIMESWRFNHYHRLEVANRSEKLYLVKVLSSHVQTDGHTELDLPALLVAMRPWATGEDEDVAMETLWFFSLLGPGAAPALPSILEVAKSPQRTIAVRTSAMYSICEVGDLHALRSTMDALLNDDSAEIRITAAQALAIYDSDSMSIAMPFLVESLSDPELRMATVSVLGSLGESAEDALPALESLLQQLQREGASESDLDHISTAIRRLRGINDSRDYRPGHVRRLKD